MKDMNEKKGFIGRLFDLSFSEFITPTIITIIYALTMVIIGLGLLAYIIVAFRFSVATGVLMLIFSPLIFLIGVIFARLWLETVIVLFSIKDDVSLIRLEKAPAESNCTNCGAAITPGSTFCNKCGNKIS